MEIFARTIAWLQIPHFYLGLYLSPCKHTSDAFSTTLQFLLLFTKEALLVIGIVIAVDC